MLLQSGSTKPTLQMQAMAFARADALVNELEWAEAWADGEAMGQANAAGEARVEAEARWWAEEEAKADADEADEADEADAAEALVDATEEAQVAQAALAEAEAAEAEAEKLARTLWWALRLAREEKQARALAHAQTEAHTVTYSEVLADSKLKDIIYSIEPKYRPADHLWRRPQHWWFIQIFAPITRLPQELLHKILLIIIDNASHSPLVLMQVSKLWYAIVTGIWGSLKLGTTTPRNAVTSKLERNQLLDVVINTELDRGDFTPSEGAYQAIIAAIQAAPRWRSLVVETFPAQTDLPEHVDSGLQQCSDVVMSQLRSFKIKCPCEMSSLLQRLLLLLGTATSGELTTVEIDSASVISFLAPTSPSIFHSVKVLCLDTPRLPNPIDLLPHLHQLESLTASHLSLPIYPNDVNIPFVHTLRHLSLRAVSIQWMSGRTFDALESCTLLYPLHRHVLHTFSTTLPNCNDLTFQGYPLDILNGISTHNLTNLTVKCSCVTKPRGGRQLLRFFSHALREIRLAPRILHIGIEATNQAWINAFTFMSNLEELVIDNTRPSSLGVKALQALVVHPVHANNLGTTATHGARYSSVCPSLKRFGLRYGRWLRPNEHVDLIPELVTIILSRQQSKRSLQSFHIWKESDQKEPLELIEGSWISLKAFERLTNNDAFKAEDLLRLVASRLAEMMSRFTACAQM